MSFDETWERSYAEETAKVGGNTFIQTLFRSFCDGHQERVLELGCGIGFNIDYWLTRHSDYYALEGSKSAVRYVHQFWPYLRERIICADFTKGIPSGNFDVIFDRAAIAHNSAVDIDATIQHVYRALKPGGIFVSCDWFSRNHTAFGQGRQIEDEGTRTDIPDGNLAGCGRAHFSDEDEIMHFFRDFQGVLLQERTIRQESAGREYKWAVWDLVMRKAR